MKYREDSIHIEQLLYRSLRFMLLFSILFFSFPTAKAQDAPQVLDSVAVTNVHTWETEAQEMKFRIPDEAKIREFKKQKEFDYTEEPPKLNWLQRIIDNIRRMLNGVTSEVFATNVLRYFVLIILVILVLLIIFKLFKIDPRKLFGRKKLKKGNDINIESENVHEMNFADLISKATKSENYRLAVRYLYLRNLKNLSDREYVVWHPSKTNTNYVQELKNEELKKNFFRTSLIFDYVWYGEMTLDKKTFEIAQSELDNFDKLLSNER